MTLTQSDWNSLHKKPELVVREQLFDALRDLSTHVNDERADDPKVLSIIPRMTEFLAERPEYSDFREPLSAAARAVGLWNYIDRSSASARDLLLADSVLIQDLGDVTLHREQLRALNKLLKGENLILSAPTSFGKSLLVDALLDPRLRGERGADAPLPDVISRSDQRVLSGMLLVSPP